MSIHRRSKCGACNGTSFVPFFHASEAAISGTYFELPPTPPLPQAVTVELECCQSCGLIRQTSDHAVHFQYERVVRSTAGQLPVYAGEIIASLARSGIGPDDLILEVGANDGSFLDRLRQAGYRNLLGVEPSGQLAERARSLGLAIRNAYFDCELAARIRAARGPARAVVCRHTLEHVPDISGFARAIADVLAPDGLSFVEVPDADWIVTQLFAHEIWDEHVSYFRPRSLAKLLENSGLRPVRLERARFRDTRNLVCWSVGKTSEISGSGDLPSDEADQADIARFQARWDAFATHLRCVVLAAPRPLIAIGAAHIQINFLNFAGLTDAVDALVDDDLSKAGHFAWLGRPVPIRSTSDIIATIRQGTLLRTAFPYPDWQDRIEGALQPYGVGSIRPYDIRQQTP